MIPALAKSLSIHSGGASDDSGEDDSRKGQAAAKAKRQAEAAPSSSSALAAGASGGGGAGADDKKGGTLTLSLFAPARAARVLLVALTEQTATKTVVRAVPGIDKVNHDGIDTKTSNDLTKANGFPFPGLGGACAHRKIITRRLH